MSLPPSSLAALAPGLRGASPRPSLDLVPGGRVQRVPELPSVPFVQFPGYGRAATLMQAQNEFRSASPCRLRSVRRAAYCSTATVPALPSSPRLRNYERARLVRTARVGGALLFGKMPSLLVVAVVRW